SAEPAVPPGKHRTPPYHSGSRASRAHTRDHLRHSFSCNSICPRDWACVAKRRACCFSCVRFVSACHCLPCKREQSEYCGAKRLCRLSSAADFRVDLCRDAFAVGPKRVPTVVRTHESIELAHKLRQF